MFCTAALAAGGSESDSARAAASGAGYAAIDLDRPPGEVGALAAHAATQAGGDVEMAARAAGFFAGIGMYTLAPEVLPVLTLWHAVQLPHRRA